jgi:hypothetical protein
MRRSSRNACRTGGWGLQGGAQWAGPAASSRKHYPSRVSFGSKPCVASPQSTHGKGLLPERSRWHECTAAFTALEAARAISPSSALTYILGSVILVTWGGGSHSSIHSLNMFSVATEDTFPVATEAASCLPSDLISASRSVLAANRA